jgi:hypothetical protein
LILSWYVLFDACSMLWCSHGLGLAPEVHELSGNGFRNGLEQASQRRQTGSLRGGGVAVLTATCLLVSAAAAILIGLDEDVVHPASAPVHGDLDSGGGESSGKRGTGEPAAWSVLKISG